MQVRAAGDRMRGGDGGEGNERAEDGELPLSCVLWPGKKCKRKLEDAAHSIRKKRKARSRDIKTAAALKSHQNKTKIQ